MVGMHFRLVRSQTIALLATLLALLWPSIASGQSSVTSEGPRLSIGAGAGTATPFHGDLEFTAPWWEAAVRGHLSRVMMVEVVFGQWRHTDEEVFLDVPLLGPGAIGHVDRIEQRTSRTMSGFEFNVLAGGVIGRARISGGGGAGVVSTRRVFRQTFQGCTPSSVNCDPRESTFTSASFAFQGVGGVDVELGRNLAAYGIVRLAVPTRDPGSSELRVAGGIRLIFW